jgi:hypothetical protein
MGVPLTLIPQSPSPSAVGASSRLRFIAARRPLLQGGSQISSILGWAFQKKNFTILLKKAVQPLPQIAVVLLLKTEPEIQEPAPQPLY